MMIVVRELLWLLFVTTMATVTTQQSQTPESPFPPPPSVVPSPLAPLLPPPIFPPSPLSADDLSRSSGETNMMMMTLLPSETEGLLLATGEAAILECRISAAGRSGNLSWTNAVTNATVTNNNTAFQNTSLKNKTLDSNEVSLVLTISNMTAARSEFRCEFDTDENQRIQKTVMVAVMSSDRFCTFEGETTSACKIGNAWTRENSLIAPSEPGSCWTGFQDHTYGKNNENGHFLVARVTGDRTIEGATLNITVRNITECIRFYYRTCVMNDSKGGVEMQMMLSTKHEISSTSLLTNQSLAALDWTEHSWNFPPQNEEQYEIIMSFTYTNASDFAYVAIDDIRTEDNNCESANDQVAKMESPSKGRTLLTTLTSTSTTNTAPTTTSNDQSSTSKTASTSEISSSTTQPASSSLSTIAPTDTSPSSLHPTTTIQLPLSTAPKRTPDEGGDSVRPLTDDKSSSSAVDEAEQEETASDEDTAAAAAAAAGDNSTGLAIGIILAIMVAGACTAAILYRRRKNGKKSTYITFGNPSYSREHLPVNDFGLDSPLTLSSNGYTVLA